MNVSHRMPSSLALWIFDVISFVSGAPTFAPVMGREAMFAERGKVDVAPFALNEAGADRSFEASCTW